MGGDIIRANVLLMTHGENNSRTVKVCLPLKLVITILTIT